MVGAGGESRITYDILSPSPALRPRLHRGVCLDEGICGSGTARLKAERESILAAAREALPNAHAAKEGDVVTF